MTQKKSPPPLNRRRAGSLLRDYREQAGLAPGEAARRLDWTTTRQGRLENGIYKVSEEDVRRLLRVFGRDDEEAVREIAAASNEDPRKARWAGYEGKVSPALLDFVKLEGDARKIRVQHPAVIPGLLQTRAYAREIVTSSAHPDNIGRTDVLFALRMDRQEVLNRPVSPAQFHALIPEQSLLHRFENPNVMKGQLRGLLEASEMENVTIQVIPLSVPAYLATSSPVTILESRHPWPAVVSIEDSKGGTLTEEPEKVSFLATVFDRICDTALPAEKSAGLIEKHLKENF